MLLAQAHPNVVHHLVPLVLVQPQHREREDVLRAQAEGARWGEGGGGAQGVRAGCGGARRGWKGVGRGGAGCREQRECGKGASLRAQLLDQLNHIPYGRLVRTPPLELAPQLRCVAVQPRALRRARGIRVRVRVQVVAKVGGEGEGRSEGGGEGEGEVGRRGGGEGEGGGE